MKNTRSRPGLKVAAILIVATLYAGAAGATVAETELLSSAGDAAPPEASSPIELPEVTVRARKQSPRKESIRDALERALRPKDRGEPPDLNTASSSMRNMAQKMADLDLDRRLGGSYTPPASFGDPPERCGADLSQGCQ